MTIARFDWPQFSRALRFAGCLSWKRSSNYQDGSNGGVHVFFAGKVSLRIGENLVDRDEALRRSTSGKKSAHC